MNKNIQAKSIMRAKGIIVGFILLVVLPFLIIELGNYYANPADKHRAEGTSPTGHYILIDDHYHVVTTSANRSSLVYSETPGSTIKDEVYSQSVDKLNWTDDYILVSSQSESAGHYFFLILDRETGEAEGYANEEAFEQGKNEKEIDIDVLDKKYFDWY